MQKVNFQLETFETTISKIKTTQEEMAEFVNK